MTKHKNPPADSPAGLLQTAFPIGTTLNHRTAALQAIRDLRQRLNDQEAQLVFELRHQGASWQAIADLTNMASRQAAQYHFARSGGLVDKLTEAMGRNVPD